MTSTLGLTGSALAPTAEPEPDPAVLRMEFNEIMRASDAGEFEYKGDPNDVKAKAEHEEKTRLRIRRGIELSQILRRQNTGPAKPKAAGRAKRGSKLAIDAAAAAAKLLE